MADKQGVRPAIVPASIDFAVAVAVVAVAILAAAAAAFPVTDFSLRHFGVRQPGRHARIDRVAFFVEFCSVQVFLKKSNKTTRLG